MLGCCLTNENNLTLFITDRISKRLLSKINEQFKNNYTTVARSSLFECFLKPSEDGQPQS